MKTLREFCDKTFCEAMGRAAKTTSICWSALGQNNDDKLSQDGGTKC